jgi:uncharacterized protein
MDLTCPKCQGTMRTYERSGITVDQCTECRGIFLDRGELERLVDAENAFHGASPAAPPPPTPSPSPSYGYPQDDRRDREYRDREYRDKEYRYKDDKDYRSKDRDYDDRHRYGDSYHHKKKKRSLFEELFD